MLGKLEAEGFEVREVFANQLSEMIQICQNLDVISKHILEFHSAKPFSEALYSLKDFISYKREGFGTHFPQILVEIEELILKLEPSQSDISLWLANYMFIDESMLSRYIEESDADEKLSMPNFETYDAFIEHISIELVNVANFNQYLPQLIQCQNSIVEKIGYSVYVRYSTIDDFLEDLNKLDINTLKQSFFLRGCLKKLKEKSFIDYKTIVLSFVKSESYKNVIPDITMHLCNSDEDIDLMSDILSMNLDLDFFVYYFISPKRNRKEVTDNNFDKLVDALIQNKCESALNQICVMEAYYGGCIQDKYIPLFLQSISSIYTNKQNHLKNCLEYLLTNPNSVDDVFKIFKNYFEQKNYIYVSNKNKEFTVLSNLIKANTLKFIDEFIETKMLEERIIDLNTVLYDANTNDVLNWIGEDQSRLEYWAKNSRFSSIESDFDESKEIIWSDLLISLLTASNNPETIIDSVFENSIFNIKSMSGNMSSELKRRYIFIGFFIEFIENNNLEKHIPYIKRKQKECQQIIEAQEKKEIEHNNENQSFDF